MSNVFPEVLRWQGEGTLSILHGQDYQAKRASTIKLKVPRAFKPLDRIDDQHRKNQLMVIPLSSFLWYSKTPMLMPISDMKPSVLLNTPTLKRRAPLNMMMPDSTGGL